MKFVKAGHFLGRVAAFLIPDLRDSLVFGGIGLVSYGINMLSGPAAFVFAGLMFIYIGVRK